MPVHDPRHLALEGGVERRLDAPGGRARHRGQHLLDEMRGQERALGAHDPQAFASRRLVVLRGEEAERPHPLEHPLLPPPRRPFVPVGIERARPLRQCGQQRGLGRR